MHQPTYIMKLYRQGPGDTPAKAMPSAGETLEEATRTLDDALLAWHQDDRSPTSQRPRIAQLEAADGSIPVAVRCVPSPRIEIVRKFHT